ncbi:MAG: peptide deformylase [Proteobacteria bacterium]|nr:peptide deformylase [Pseudomonadota bacterium]MBU1640749.1 peptide deformylase [Pseudomonadota bacterium]
MALREILKYPNPLLRKKAEKVTAFDDALQKLIADMAETMYDAPGVGLAAPQIGASLQLLVMDITSREEEPELIVLINPEISEGEGSEIDEEGCLSVVDLTAKVKRFSKIRVKAQDAEGNHLDFIAEEWFARVIQHEVDHLNGTLFIDHLSSLKRALYKKKRKKQLAEVSEL